MGLDEMPFAQDCSVPAQLVRAQIIAAQDHILEAIEGLDAAALTREVAPSGWRIANLLGHLAYDDEIFWAQAILCGDPAAIGHVQNGWEVEWSDPLDAVRNYRATVDRTRDLLDGIDLAAAPKWWPPQEVFPFPQYATGWECAFQLLVDVHTHAGHLDLVRELIDGRQHLVVD